MPFKEELVSQKIYKLGNRKQNTERTGSVKETGDH